jgi:penicillin-binding protein 1A
MNIFSYDGSIDTVLTPMDSIRWIKHYLRCGFVSLDARTGAVKAYVGGPDFTTFQYDMVNSGRRQVGSTIKPFLYTLAMSEGFWPCDSVLNDEITLVDRTGKKWTPRDGHTKTKGEMKTLRWGLQVSSNWITAYLMSVFTPEQMVKMMRSFGITSPITPVISLCLGPCEINLQEMVSSYTTFTNKGIRMEPMYVTRIEDNNGKVLATFAPVSHEVISEETTYKMLDMLKGVMDGGTGGRVRHRYGFRAPAGGKTGTSQNNSDGWFIGFTPSLVSGAWVGGEDRSIHFDRTAVGQGANTALPIWAYYMKKVYADETLGYDSKETFDVPKWFKANRGCW